MPGTTVTGPGLYGKLPARGDFLTRRLPRDFVDPWDHWLQEALAASRRILGEDWLPRYLVSPLWRFALAPGVCGPRGMAGVLMPSVDRVGRYFPLTLAAGLEGAPSLADPRLEDWFAGAEELLLEALADALDLEDWVGRIGTLGPPPATTPPGPPPPAGQDRCHPLAGDSSPPDLTAPGLWWTTGAEHVPPCLLTTRNLPQGESFTALLDGRWQDHGWTLSESTATDDPHED